MLARGRLRSRFAAPQAINAETVGNAKHPRGKGAALRIIRVRALPYAPESFLDNLFGHLVLPQHATCQALDTAGIPIIQSLQCSIVLHGDPSHQLIIAQFAENHTPVTGPSLGLLSNTQQPRFCISGPHICRYVLGATVQACGPGIAEFDGCGFSLLGRQRPGNGRIG